jgi:hypothetical protein
MQNRRERRKLLRQFGLLKPKKGYKFNDFSSIEEGKEIHRKNVQEMVNRQIQEERSFDKTKKEDPEFFFYRNQDTDYSGFQSMLLNKNWDDLEKD